VLYILDMEQKKLIVIDPKPIPEYALDVPYKAYANTDCRVSPTFSVCI
jgi:hypothetical protein